MAVEPIAAQHAERQVTLARRTASELSRLWALINPARITESWTELLPQALSALGTSQATAAAGAAPYVDDILEAQGIEAAAAGRISPGAFAGVASDGRPLASLLLEPPIAALSQIKQGASPARALSSGRFLLDMIARTQVADAGRTAVGAAIAARPAVGGYVRMIVGKTCSRCLILAGRRYEWNAGFKRHPRCDCRHVPVAEDVPGDVRTNPRAYFDSLSADEQDELLGAAGAQAVRDGADMARVVNARRGMYEADGRLLTREATTKRGINRPVRMMPEQILRDAKDRDDAIRLLRTHGYIIGRPAPAAPATPTFRPVLPPEVVAPRIRIRPPEPTPRVIAPAARPYADRLAAAAAEADALAAARFGLGRRPRPDEFTSQMSRAVNTYTGSEYSAINRHLRGQRLPYGYEAADVVPTIADLDLALAASRLDRDVVVHRGVLDASQMFGERLGGNLAGMQWREDAYLSTTARARKAAGFADATAQAPMVMRIVVPRGTPAIEASGMDLEAEVLLARGQRLRVVEDRGVDPSGVRHVDVEVLGD